MIVRDEGGLYAISNICTHAGCTVRYEPQYPDFYCPCHGAVFDQDGRPVSGPVDTPLVQYALCVLDNGNVAIDANETVPAGTRVAM
jgi:cytochrome b6-f complex iron-sulfur subunit